MAVYPLYVLLDARDRQTNVERRHACASVSRTYARMCHSFHVVVVEVVLEICGGQVGKKTCVPLGADSCWAGGARRVARGVSVRVQWQSLPLKKSASTFSLGVSWASRRARLSSSTSISVGKPPTSGSPTTSGMLMLCWLEDIELVLPVSVGTRAPRQERAQCRSASARARGVQVPGRKPPTRSGFRATLNPTLGLTCAVRVTPQFHPLDRNYRRKFVRAADMHRLTYGR